MGFYALPPLPGPPGLTRLPSGHTSSQASVCSFKSTKLAQMISEVQSEHSSYFFQQILLDVCLSETFCLALSSKNVCPLLQLAPFTTLDEEPFAKRGSWPSTPTPAPHGAVPHLFLAVMGLAMSPLKTRKWKVTSCTYLCPFLKLSQK